ncbi:MAG: hypothetical protein KY445_05230 [Armatimonadetes bacterium]|nr:hypothetical protein [Armatimonadota bacterium]
MTISRAPIPFLLLCCSLCLAAAANAQTAPQPVAPTGATTSANEDYELNIVKKRIVESPMERSADVALADAGRGGVSVRVGFNVVAQYAAISLRGVYGRVQFRASLAPIERVLERHRAVPALPAAPQVAPQ